MPDYGTVLMVDDDREIKQEARVRLRSAGYTLLDANDGEQGVSAAVASHPDVILMDVRMPRKDGLTALSDLKQRADTREIPVVMLSASVVDQKAALDAGARFFLKKPYRGETLIQAVQAAMATRNKKVRFDSVDPMPPR
jgi:CheY-like chemotaxis protein